MQQSPESLESLIPKLHKKVFHTPADVFHPEAQEESPITVGPPSEQDRSVSLSQDELEGVQDILNEEENNEMMKALQESKKAGFLDEEARRAAWLALGQDAPGTSSGPRMSGGKRPVRGKSKPEKPERRSSAPKKPYKAKDAPPAAKDSG